MLIDLSINIDLYALCVDDIVILLMNVIKILLL